MLYVNHIWENAADKNRGFIERKDQDILFLTFVTENLVVHIKFSVVIY